MNQQQTQLEPAVVRRNRLMFIGVIVIFVAPVLLAYYMYKSGWRPSSTVNHGTLVQPARPSPEFKMSIRADGRTGGDFDQHGLEKLWNLVIVVDGSCNKACLNNIYAIRQIQTAQGKNQVRIRRVLIHTGDDAGLEKIAASYPKMVILEAGSKAFSTLRAWFTVKDQTGIFDGSRVYMVDPLGNFMMYYLPGYDPTGMRKDMVRLLKVSHIG